MDIVILFRSYLVSSHNFSSHSVVSHKSAASNAETKFWQKLAKNWTL
jgi:hypothetical protein